MKIERWNIEEEGALTESALRRKMELRGFTVSSYVYPPGTYFPPHKHENDKMDAVLSGRFRIAMCGESAVLGPGDLVEIPLGTEHEVEVMGEESVVSLDAIRLR